MTRTPVIPLEAVASDAVELIAAFRDTGGTSFGSAAVAEARDSYLASCRRNGVPNEAVDHVEDLVCPVVGGTITVRRYAALPPSGDAAIVFLHGGGWALGDLETHDPICRYLATATGLPVFAVDYRRAPEHRFPIPLDDCAAALRFVAEHAAGLGAESRRLVIVGDSAGGNLAAVLANDPAMAVEGTAFLGQVLLYPVTDLSSESASYARIAEGFPLVAESMRWFADLYLADDSDPADPRLSPLRLDRPVAPPPPAFIVSLGLDPLGDEGIAYASHLARHGGHVEHHHLPRHAHGIFTSAGRIPTGRRMLDRAVAFIQEVAS